LSSREIARRLADFELDVGVTYLDDDSAASMRVAQLYRERFLLLMPLDCPLARERVVEWSDAAELPLCALTQDMRNRRILDAAMATAGARLAPVMETDNVGALYAHIATRGLSSIVSHAWVHAFGVPAGSCVRLLADPNPNPPVGLVALPREPSSILVDGVWEAMEGADLPAEFERSLAGVLDPGPQVG
jgi:DNA-binding transcriptional LysR family regulator